MSNEGRFTKYKDIILNFKTVGRNRSPGLIFPVLILESWPLKTKGILLQKVYYFLLTAKHENTLADQWVEIKRFLF